MALPDLTGQNIQDTYKRVLTIGDGGVVFDGTGSKVTTLKMTASYAITEVNYETSSSYAETASLAGSLTGLTSTITELNYLDGVLSTVKNADHYCTLKTNPYWAKGKKTVAVINNHKFYRLNK